MYIKPCIYMDATTEQIFAPHVVHYTDLLLKRFLPIFDDLDGEQERVADEVYYADHWGPEDGDAAAEAAYDHSISYIQTFMEMRTTFIASGVAGLFHLFEKQIYTNMNHEFGRRPIARNGKTVVVDKWETADLVIKEFTNGVNVVGPTLQDSWNKPDLIELRLVANAVKHGPGRALDALIKMGAAVVNPERIKDDWTVSGHLSPNAPISIQTEDVERYRDAVLAFWKVRGAFYLPDAEQG